MRYLQVVNKFVASVREYAAVIQRPVFLAKAARAEVFVNV